MIKRVFYIIFSAVFISCSSDPEIPPDILQPKEMANVLWDVMQSQNLAYETARKDSTVSEAVETKILSQKIFNIHKIDSASFNRSYNWYVAHPAILKVIFDSLYAQKERANVLNLEKKNRPDSL